MTPRVIVVTVGVSAGEREGGVGGGGGERVRLVGSPFVGTLKTNLIGNF